VSALLVCSVGGHLAELHTLVPRIPEAAGERLWVTFDTMQSRSLLAEEDVLYLDYTGPRDWRRILRHCGRARRLLIRGHPFEHAISTGSGIALSFLPWARLRGVPCHYIESYTRIEGPSATGRILGRLPGISTLTQHPRLAHGAWRHTGTVFDEYRAGAPSGGSRAIRRVVVTLGTMRDYPFDRLVLALRELLPAGCEVLWQVSCTDLPGFAPERRIDIPQRELAESIGEADLVIAHCGCGSAMTALAAGKLPLLVPRRAAFGENVDDHQAQLGAELARRGLAVVREVEELDSDALRLAASGSVLRAPLPPRFSLAR
jgi:UDP-N-acetylglucosamine--N-acetylmuramyl-(pentapeptide) pyrophosphoryl-undecaprenol N-acetylglucosamine transferase